MLSEEGAAEAEPEPPGSGAGAGAGAGASGVVPAEAGTGGGVVQAAAVAERPGSAGETVGAAESVGAVETVETVEPAAVGAVAGGIPGQSGGPAAGGWTALMNRMLPGRRSASGAAPSGAAPTGSASPEALAEVPAGESGAAVATANGVVIGQRAARRRAVPAGRTGASHAHPRSHHHTSSAADAPGQMSVADWLSGGGV